MKKRSRTVTLALLTAAFVAGACRGDGGVTSETGGTSSAAERSFGNRVSAASSTFNTRLEEIFDPINGEFSSASLEVAIGPFASE